MAFRALVAGLILSLSLFSPSHAVVPELRQPAWAELSQEEKQILAPLSRDWDRMEAVRKKKWLGIAKRYPSMKPEEQARVQRRMQEWTSLTPEQRTQARTQYKNLKTVPPVQKQGIKEKWEQYKELPDEEKKRLTEKAARNAAPKASAGRPTPKKSVSGLSYLPEAAAPAKAASLPVQPASDTTESEETPSPAAASEPEASAETAPAASGTGPDAAQQQ